MGVDNLLKNEELIGFRGAEATNTYETSSYILFEPSTQTRYGLI